MQHIVSKGGSLRTKSRREGMIILLKRSVGICARDFDSNTKISGINILQEVLLKTMMKTALGYQYTT